MDLINVALLAEQESLRRLGVKPQTLYANVSRGRIAARPDPADPRRSLYNRDDVDRLARKSVGPPAQHGDCRRGHGMG